MRVVIGVLGFIAGALLVIIVDHQPWLMASIKHNTSWMGVREWIGATSGWAAAAVAVPTIILLRRQLDQARRSEQEHIRGIAETLEIDLIDTAARLPTISMLHELNPPMSDVARHMIMDATKVAPELAIAVQKHCREIASLDALIRARTLPGPGQINHALIANVNKLAFRAIVLAECLGMASTQIKTVGRAVGPFITSEKLTELENQYNVTVEDRAYLKNLFDVYGFI